jgi:hypothetical protein
MLNKITDFICRELDTWRGIPRPPKPAPKIPEVNAALVIWYQYSPVDMVRSFTYSTEKGRPIMYYHTTREFIKWYFGRLQSPSIFITGSNNKTEWRRTHILHIEMFKDEKDAEKATERKHK